MCLLLAQFCLKILKFLFECENPHRNFKHKMCTLEADELEREIVCVGLDMHKLNVKFHSQLKNLKQLCHEASLLVESMLDALGHPAVHPTFVNSAPHANNYIASQMDA